MFEDDEDDSIDVKQALQVGLFVCTVFLIVWFCVIFALKKEPHPPHLIQFLLDDTKGELEVSEVEFERLLAALESASCSSEDSRGGLCDRKDSFYTFVSLGLGAVLLKGEGIASREDIVGDVFGLSGEVERCPWFTDSFKQLKTEYLNFQKRSPEFIHTIVVLSSLDGLPYDETSRSCSRQFESESNPVLSEEAKKFLNGLRELNSAGLRVFILFSKAELNESLNMELRYNCVRYWAQNDSTILLETKLDDPFSMVAPCLPPNSSDGDLNT